MAEDGEELVVLLQRGRDAGEAQQHLAGALSGEMEADCRHAPRDRAADVEQIRIALGARADHRVGKRDCVRFAPRDLLAERRPHVGLVRRAGPHRHRAHLLVGEHLPCRLRGPVGRDGPVLPAALVHAADVEARRHRDARAKRGEPLREIERRVTQIDRAVDVRLRDVHQLGGAVHVRHPYEDRHREPRGGTTIAVQHRPIVIAQLQHRR